MTEAPAHDNWQPDVQALWDQGRRQAALGSAAATGVFKFSLVHPNALEMLENLAVVVGRQGRHGEAVTLFDRVLALKTLAAQPLPGWRPPAETPRQHPGSTRNII